jgi:hypothetical protein
MTAIRILALSLACATLAARNRPAAIPDNPDAATILHLLKRTSYGPRPGDLERVREIGLAKYIDQQLHPERLADAAMSARLSGFDTLDMSTRELAERYYIPAMMERRARQRERATNGETQTGQSPDAANQRAERQRGVAGAGGGAPARV